MTAVEKIVMDALNVPVTTGRSDIALVVYISLFFSDQFARQTVNRCNRYAETIFANPNTPIVIAIRVNKLISIAPIVTPFFMWAHIN